MNCIFLCLHWYAVVRIGEFECFDSLGVTEAVLRSRLPRPMQKSCTFNENRLQPSLSKLCGPFSILFVTARFLNSDLSFSQVLSEYFSQSDVENEKIVTEFWASGGYLVGEL